MTKQTLLQSIGAGMALTAAISFSLTSCQDEISENSHYQAPSFLVGNALEVLQKPFEGHTFKTFLRGIELVGYNDVADSQILTLLAPTDEAFAQFLKEKGYASIDEMYKADPTYTQQVITYHMLYYAMDWDKMTNFRPLEGDGATEQEKSVQAGMFNRFRTRCVEKMERQKNVDARFDTDSVDILHYDRYVTVFSEKLFATLGIDAQSNYNYFFPNTTWNPNHLANGFNVMNAAVLDKEAVVTDNGYLYHIDHVIEPVGTIYEEISKRSEYQLIKKLFDNYEYVAISATETENRGDTVYNRHFYNLPDIASEWASMSYLNFSMNSYSSYNMFIPTDEGLTRLFKEFWEPGCGYDDVTELDELIQRILLLESLGYIQLRDDSKATSSYICFPEYISTGKAASYFGSPLTTAPSDFNHNLMCNNGVLYGSSKMDLPGVFSGVTGAAFKNKKYLNYLYVLNGADQLLSLSSPEVDFVALIPDSAQFSHQEPAIRLFKNQNEVPVTSSLQQWSDQEADYLPMSSSVMTDMVNMNTTTAVTELKTQGSQVIETNASFNYWYVRDGKITTNALFNEQLNPTFKGQVWSTFHEIPRSAAGGQWSNGKAYSYDYAGVYMPASSVSLEKELSQSVDRNYPYYCFAQLLQMAGLTVNKDNEGKFVTSGSTTIRFLSEPCRFFAIVPTNDAIKASLKELPGCSSLNIDLSTLKISGTLAAANKTKLAEYLLNYFVTADRASFSAYPYLGSACKGEFTTSGQYTLNITDYGNKLSVKWSGESAEGNEVDLVGKYYYLPFVYGDGAFQLIDTVLK